MGDSDIRFMYLVVCFTVTPKDTHHSGSDSLYWFPSPCLFKTLEEAATNVTVLERNKCIVASVKRVEVGFYTPAEMSTIARLSKSNKKGKK